MHIMQSRLVSYKLSVSLLIETQIRDFLHVGLDLDPILGSIQLYRSCQLQVL